MQENGDTTIDVEAARDALEKFVMENDELLELEARIGRFNIFDALGIVNAEIRHSNFLGWLLDPAESHGAGDLFLKAVLMDMLRQTNQELRPKGVSPIHLDGTAITSVDIRREWKNIDLLIRCESPRLVIAIENKIRSGEHGGQLLKYKKIVREAFPHDPSMFVFLTREGDVPSDEDWTTYSYAQLKGVFERVRRTNEGAIGEDVDTFLDHYLDLIESRLMEDPEIDRLCKNIYRNHRQAIDLIIQRAASSSSALVAAAEEVIASQPERWLILGSAQNVVQFIPTIWLDTVPEIGVRPNFDKRAWLYHSFWVDVRACCCGVRNVIRRTSNEDIRIACVRELTKANLGFKRSKQTLGNDWNSLGKERLLSWKEGQDADPETLRPLLLKRLDRYWDKAPESRAAIERAVKSVPE